MNSLRLGTKASIKQLRVQQTPSASNFLERVLKSFQRPVRLGILMMERWTQKFLFPEDILDGFE
jgi:hypothetical protein